MPRKPFRRLLPAACLVFVLAAGIFIHSVAANQIFAKEQSGQSVNEQTAAGPTGYHPAEKDPDPAEMQKSIALMETRALQLQKEIAEIRNAAFAENPALDHLLRELVLTVDSVMTQNLKQEEFDPERLKQIDEKLQDPEVSPARKNQLEEKKKKAFLGYKKAEMRTENNLTIQRLREEFYTELMETSKKINPDTEKMINELDNLRHQLRFVKPEARQ